MNSVFWFLYAIDVIGNVKTMAFVAVVFCGIVFFVTIAAVPLSDGDCLDDDSRPTWYKFFWRSLAGGLVGFVLFSVLPSTNTMYAIAASQVGEKIVASERVQGIADDATKALHQWIKKQIEPVEPKK